MTTTDLHQVGLRLDPPIQHVPEQEYLDCLAKVQTPLTLKASREGLRRFTSQYATLSDWLAEPLETRLGRLRGEGRKPSDMTSNVNYKARQYLMYASLTGRLELPWDYLLMLDLRRFAETAGLAGHSWLPTHVHDLIEQAKQRDWSHSSANQAIHFCLPRFALRYADPLRVKELTAVDFEVLRGEIGEVYATVSPHCNTRWQEETRRLGRGALSAAFGAHAIHFQLGLVHDGPKQTRPSKKLVSPQLPAAIADAFDAWRLYDESRGTPLSTRRNHDLHMRYFATFLVECLPDVTELSQLIRAHILDYLHWLASRKQLRPPHPILSESTRRSAISTLSIVLRDLHENDLAAVPGHALIHRNDYPRIPTRLPRFIPKPEMRLVVRAMSELTDPFQRASLITARWSGARRDEIARLELDCLDTYDDGTYRLRIPAGKTRKERMIPLAEEAAEAIQIVQGLRAGDHDQGTTDRVTKQRVRYLFSQRGRHLSKSYLFDTPLLTVCTVAGLLTESGGRVVTAHRFRHTLGTDLAEQGARWRTIMTILGHETADMTMVYAHISDPEVKADYEKVVASGAAIAGPAAILIKNGTLPQAELDWLQTNFFKSEMELGACTRLPEEGPCECDLFLNCSKFFTTKEHAPRLRRRWDRELVLLQDADARGWPREVERHRGIQIRLEALLADLGEPLEEPGEHLSLDDEAEGS